MLQIPLLKDLLGGVSRLHKPLLKVLLGARVVLHKPLLKYLLWGVGIVALTTADTSTRWRG